MTLVVLVVLVSLPFLALIAFRPVLRRLAMRNAARRPRETALVIVGSMLGTAILTGSFVVGDTLEASLRRSAHENLGPIDQVVTSPDPEHTQAIVQLLSASPDPRIDGILPMTTMSPVAVVTTTGRPLAAPRAQVLEVDFGDARAFGGDARATGIDGPTPAPGSAAVSADLATRLELTPGDTIETFAYGRSLRFKVERVLPRLGIAGFGSGGAPMNVFVSPGTIARLAPEGQATQRTQTMVAVSNRGGVEAGAELSDEVSKLITSTVALPGIQVRTVKKDVLDGAAEAGEQFAQLFTAMGTFGVLAGLLLLVNIFVMLAEERRSEMGMMRALGLRRSGLVAAFSLEGWMYSLGAAAVGSIAGIGLGRVIGVAAAGIFSGGFGGGAVELTFAAKASSLQRGFALGFLIALVTVVVTSVRISRFNVIQAIRDLNEQPARRTGRRAAALGLAGVAAGLVWTTIAFRGNGPFGSMIAPILVVGSLVPLFGRVLPRRAVASIASILALAWGVTGMRFFRDAAGDANLMLFVAQGIILTGSAVALVSVNQDAVGAALRRAGGGARSLALRLGVAYPLARSFRTGMTLAMYTLVIFTLTFITVFSHIVQGQVRTFAAEAAGGFDVIVTSNATNPVDPDAIARRPGVQGVAALRSTFAEFTTRTGHSAAWGLAAFDNRWIELGPPGLSDRGAYASDADAYRAVLTDPSLIIVNSSFLRTRRATAGPPRRLVEIGDTVTMSNPLTLSSREVEVAAIASGGVSQFGALYGLDGAESLLGERLVTNPVFVATRGVDNDLFATELSAAFLANGAEANAIESMISQARGRELQFFGLIRGYLALGLLVGIAGLGVVMVRAVRERRRQIGVLRALGFEARTVRRSFVIESGFVALEGIVIGVALALVNSYSLVANSGAFGGNLTYGIPVPALAVLVLGTLAVSLAATAAPSQAASRIRPAVALRIAD